MTVKPLTWVSQSIPAIHGRHIGKTRFQIDKDRLAGRGWELTCFLHAPSYTTYYSNEEEAKLAAEQQWDTFVRTAVEETPSPDWTNEGRNP